MKYIFLVFTSLILFSCGNEKVVMLPEIDHSEITEITDVSAAYIFYDETKPDSTELNRRNLISTTNWLVNVDRRLTLKQAIPYIQFLQNKKLSASHKNENAKNYFTCNNLNIKNLGFIEFTNISYQFENSPFPKLDPNVKNEENFGLEQYEHLKGILEHMPLEVVLNFRKNNLIYGNSPSLKNDYQLLDKTNINQFLTSHFTFMQPLRIELILNFESTISFQEYISYKQFAKSLVRKSIEVSTNEFIVN